MSPLLPHFIRLPTASRPRLNFFANCSFTTATSGVPVVSDAREFAAGEELHAERREKARPDDVDVRVRVRVRTGLEALHRHVAAPVVVVQHGDASGGHTRDAGLRAELVLDPLEDRARSLLRIAVELR